MLMRELGAGDEADAQRQLLNEAFGEVKYEWGEIAGGVGYSTPMKCATSIPNLNLMMI